MVLQLKGGVSIGRQMSDRLCRTQQTPAGTTDRDLASASRLSKGRINEKECLLAKRQPSQQRAQEQPSGRSYSTDNTYSSTRRVHNWLHTCMGPSKTQIALAMRLAGTALAGACFTGKAD